MVACFVCYDGTMRIILCDDISYCGGVRRAIGIVKTCLSTGKRPIYTLGELIHNPDVCGYLERNGVRVVNDPEDAAPGILVIRAHGVGDGVRESFMKAGYTIYDATCPIVRHNLQSIKSLSKSRSIIVVGDKGHDEVKAMSQVEGVPVLNISSPEEVNAIPADKAYALFVQTTFSSEAYDAICTSVRKRGLHVLFANKICPSSEKRRKAIARLAAQCDAVLIVGGRNSANTKALYNLVLSLGKKGWMIENETEVTDEMRDVPLLGLASGASTSMQMIRKVQDCLEKNA